MKKITEKYADHTKDELLVEAKSRGIESVNTSTLKDDIVAALELDDEDTKGPEQPSEPLPKLKASPIPQVAAIPEVSDVSTGGTPKDEDYTDGIFVKRKGDWQGEEFALAIHEPDTYGRTHSCKNSLHFWQGNEDEFDAAFKSK